MTNPINGGLPVQTDPANATPLARSSIPGANGSIVAPGTSGIEAVTLSADAQTRTQLLDASRTSPGIDQQKIIPLRNAVQSNSYQVPPEDLATAIATALKERQS